MMEDVDIAIDLFKKRLEMYHPYYNVPSQNVSWSTVQDQVLLVSIAFESEEKHLTLDTNESYELKITSTENKTIITITAETFFGARHGLQTVAHLINYNEENNCLQIINDVHIEKDNPAFPYRGLTIDTARNFLEVDDIKRTMDAMAENKLNTFHWHMTDTNAIPIVFESYPQMNNYGALAARQLYHPTVVRELVEYGRQRGIRVLPELDSPAHVGNGWQWGPEYGLGDLAVCVNQVRVMVGRGGGHSVTGCILNNICSDSFFSFIRTTDIP